MSLQRLKVTPDKFINLTTSENVSLPKIRDRTHEKNHELCGDELDRVARHILNEYAMNMNTVRGSFRQFIYDCDCSQVTKDNEGELTDKLITMLKLRYKSDAPRRPPRVILLGPPGSSRST